MILVFSLPFANMVEFTCTLFLPFSINQNRQVRQELGSKKRPEEMFSNLEGEETSFP
jgi:hypothetical protein